jgi:competence protein ComEC
MEILLVITSGFASGVLLRSLFHFGWPVYAFVGVLALVLGGAWSTTRRRAYLFSIFFFLFLGLGAVRFSVSDTPLPPALAAQVGQRVQLEGTVALDPDVRDASQRVTVDVSQGGEQTRVLVVAGRYTQVGVGDTVEVSGTLTPPQPFATDGGRTFRYDKFLEKDGVRFLLNFSSIQVVTPAPWYSVSALLANAKHSFISGLGQALPEPYATLAGGLIVGGKQGLGAELLNAFIISGLVQIIVLSGYNVMIVAEGVMRLLGAIKVPRRAAAIAGGVAILLFVLMAGAGSASVRAGLMALIALYARATTRTYAAGRALLLVSLAMSVWNPFLLAFDPGFDLSVAATAGLIWLSPWVEMKLVRIKNNFWRSMIATTLSAQVAVLPLLLYETGTLSLVAIPANLLVLAVVPAAMAASAIAAVGGMFLGILAPAVAFPAYLLNRYIIEVAKFSASLPHAALHLAAFPFWLVLAAYAALICLYFRYCAATSRSSATPQLKFSKKASI